MKPLCDPLLKTDSRSLAEKPVGTAGHILKRALLYSCLGFFAVIYEIKLRKFSEVTSEAVGLIIRGWEAAHSTPQHSVTPPCYNDIYYDVENNSVLLVIVACRR